MSCRYYANQMTGEESVVGMLIGLHAVELMHHSSIPQVE
jgi:hypothetical protein